MAVRGIKKDFRHRVTKAPANVTPARRAAFDVLRRVEEDGAFAAVLLAHVADGLRIEDRALCYELTLGVLRRQLWLDKLIEYYAGRGAEGIDAPVRRALRLGLYQLRFLTRVPASAAVNESVNLAHAEKLGGAAKFVNAVLRRATREPDFNPASSARDEIEGLSIETSHPRWLIEKWMAAFGNDEAAAFARANNQTPPVAVRVNEWKMPGAEVSERLRAAGVEMKASEVAPSAWRVNGAGGAVLRELAREGIIYTQDEASQLIAHVLGARGGERILDVCAAPGSKATHIAGLAGAGTLVVAGDLYGHRLRVLLETAARQDLENICAVAFDAEQTLPFPAAIFDRVLVDAPCTGTGTLRHNPEIRWRLTPAHITELSTRQQSILDNVAPLVRVDGRLVYSTCSVEREENESIVARFLRTHTNFAPAQLIAPAHLLTGDGATARTWPQRDGADGFFIAAFERKN